MHVTLDDILMDLDRYDRDERDLDALVPLDPDEYRPLGWKWRGFHYGEGQKAPLPVRPEHKRRNRSE